MTQAVSPSNTAVVALLEQLRLIDVAVRRNLEGITHDESLRQPRPAGNCINWVLGHLVVGFQTTMADLGIAQDLSDIPLERYRRGQPPIQDPSDACDLEELMRAWNASVHVLTRAMSDHTGAAVGSHPASPTASGDANPLTRLALTLFHQAYHAGQLGTLRRLLGKDGAIP